MRSKTYLQVNNKTKNAYSLLKYTLKYFTYLIKKLNLFLLIILYNIEKRKVTQQRIKKKIDFVNIGPKEDTY